MIASVHTFCLDLRQSVWWVCTHWYSVFMCVKSNVCSPRSQPAGCSKNLHSWAKTATFCCILVLWLHRHQQGRAVGCGLSYRYTLKIHFAMVSGTHTACCLLQVRQVEYLNYHHNLLLGCSPTCLIWSFNEVSQLTFLWIIFAQSTKHPSPMFLVFW